jgi:DNA repair photolyase
MAVPLTIHGRGAADNPANRFQSLHIEPDAESAGVDPDQRIHADTVFLVDSSRSIIATNDSPDIGFDASVNPYRGCEHGCIYCYARPTHEYLGLSAGLDFETRILVKTQAAALLREELSSPRWEPRTLSFCGVTDAYQPIERRLEITRACLSVLAEFNNPVCIVTKSALVTRDTDILGRLAGVRAAAVFVTITTLDNDLSGRLEPRAAAAHRRLGAIRALSEARIPVGVMVSPVIPGLTDHEIPAILQAAAEHGAAYASYTPIRLPLAVAPLFSDWLMRHYPQRREKILNRIRSMHEGKLNDPRFGTRMRGTGLWADQFRTMFRLARRRAGLDRSTPELSIASFRRPGGKQLTLW